MTRNVICLQMKQRAWQPEDKHSMDAFREGVLPVAVTLCTVAS